MSCESVASETSELDTWDNECGSAGERKIEIPDIKTWLKNPTDFIKFPMGRQPSDEIGTSDGKASKRNDSLTDAEPCVPQILVSMSYLPTAERLSVVIVRVRMPNFISAGSGQQQAEQHGYQQELSVPKMVYVKAYLVDEETGKRAYKKKTSLKPFEQGTSNSTTINFNELMIFKLPINKLSKTGIRISVTGLGGVIAQNDADEETRITSIGSVLLGSSSPLPSGVSHFATMTTTMRKPITMWHTLQH